MHAKKHRGDYVRTYLVIKILYAMSSTPWTIKFKTQGRLRKDISCDQSPLRHVLNPVDNIKFKYRVHLTLNYEC